MDGAPPPGYMLVPVQGNSAADPANQLVPFKPPPRPEPPKEPPMVPGKTYITIPPGHSKPAFVRKKAPNIGWGFGLLADAFANPRRDVIQVTSKPKEEPKPKPETPQVYSPYFYLTPQQLQQLQLANPGLQPGVPQPQAQQQLPAPPLNQTAPNPAPPQQPPIAAPAASANEVKIPDGKSNLTIARHECFYCHKVRSAGYHHRHPILPGQILLPTVCRKCERQRTPSGDEDEQKKSLSASAKKKSKDKSQKRQKDRKEKKEATRKQKHDFRKSDEESLVRSQNDGLMYRSRRQSPLSGFRYVPVSTRTSPREAGREQLWESRRDNMMSEGEETEWVRSRFRIKHRSRSEESRGLFPLRDGRRTYPRGETHFTSTNYLASPSSREIARATRVRRSCSRSSSRGPVRYDDYERGLASSEDETHIIRRTVVKEPTYEIPRDHLQSETRSRSRSADNDQRGVRRYTVLQSRPISQAYSPSQSAEDRGRGYQEPGRRVFSYPDAYRRGHDSDFDQESQSQSQSRSQSRAYETPTRQGSYMSSEHHASTPYPKRNQERGDSHNDRPRGTYSGHIHNEEISPAGQRDHGPPLPSRRRSISRPVRNYNALESQRHGDSDTADAGGPRVQFVRDTSTRRNTISDRESDVAGPSRRRQRQRAADFDGYRHDEAENKYASARRFTPSITYKAPSPPRPAAAPWHPQPRYLTAEPHYSETEISDMLRGARIAYSPSLSPRGRSRSRGGSSTRGRSVSHNRGSSARSTSYVSQSSAGRSEQNSAGYEYARPSQRTSSGWSVSSANTERPTIRFETSETGRSTEDVEMIERQVVAGGRDCEGEYYDIAETVTLGGREGRPPSWSENVGEQPEAWESQNAPAW
ncbi:MAG: hypothetical protein M1812_006685 [Candelaria pacifica]|nr:MAG: hypothetical protein M1812_006685 [Candelaria pacifica]